MSFFGFIRFLIPIIIMTMCYLYVKMKMETLVYTMAIESYIMIISIIFRYAFDVFIICSAVVVLSIITSYAWLLYLTVFIILYFKFL